MVKTLNHNALTGSKVLVLLSGGIDSAACVNYYLSRGRDVSSLFVDYGQPSRGQESEAAVAVARHYSIGLHRLVVSGCVVPQGYIRARNAMLLTMALMNFGHRPGIISLGVHAGTPYADCSPEFVQGMQQIYDLYEHGCVRIDAPFIEWTKLDIWTYAKAQNVPLHLTHSNNLDSLPQAVDYLRTDR